MAGGADFVVAAEVKTSGAQRGVRELTADTSKLADSSRKLGEENRRLKTSSQELAEAERRRIGLAADMVRSVKSQITALAEYQRQLVATRNAESARAAMAGRISVSSIGVDPSGKLGVAIQALMEKERQLRASVQETAEEIARAERVAANVAGIQARTREMQEALVAAQQGVNAERAYREALEARRAVEASGAAPGTSQAAVVEREVAAQRELTAQLGAVARARERDEDAAREENAQRDRVAGEIARLRETTSQLEILASAHRRGSNAVREANIQLEVRNALLRQGVAAGSADAAIIERQIRQQERLRAEINQSTAAKARATQGVFSLRNAFFALQGLLATLGLAALVRESVGVALALDRAQKALVAVSGSQMMAGQEMAFVRAEADRLGLVLTSTAQAYASLTAASKGTTLQGQPTREIFSAVSEAAVVLGLSADQSNGALLSLQQMMSKGTVQAEELRGQLGERLPGAFQIAARAMGVTTAELGKMLEGGEVMAADLLPKLAVELRKTFGPGLVNAVTSAQANLNRLKNDLDQLKASLGRGFLEGFLAGFQDLRTALTDQDLQRAARDLGESIGFALRSAAEVAAFLANNLDLVKAVLLVVVSLKAAAFFVGLSQAIAQATGSTIAFKAASSNLLLSGVLGLIAAALVVVVIAMQDYISKSRAAHAVEMDRVARSQEIFGYYNTLKANKEGLTRAEWDYGKAVRGTIEAERAALAVSLARTRSQFEASKTLNPFKYQQVAGPGRNVLKQQVGDQERELKTLENQLNILDSQWSRLSQLPVIDPIAPGADDKAGKLAAKLTDILEGFRRTADQAERIARANQEGPIPARDVTDAIERENAAYQALNSVEGLSAESKRKLSVAIGELVGRTQDANRVSEEAVALRERDLAYNNSALEAEARLADVKAGSTEASRQLAAALEAEAIARAKFSEDDPRYSALVNALTGEIRLRADYLVSIQQQIEADGRLAAHQEELTSLEAQLRDVIEGSTAATRANTAAVAAATIIKGLSAEEAERSAEAIRNETAARAEEVRALTAQIAAEERLQAQQGEISSLKAVISDYAEQAAAAREYGSEVAQILQQYGLLNSATRELVIQEQILAAVREEGLDRSDFWHRMRILEIEDEIRAHADMVDSLNAYMATAELGRYVNEPIDDAWRQTGEVIRASIVDLLLSAFGQAEFNFKDFLKNLLRMWAQAMVEMFARWLATQKAMAATNIATGQGGTGGWLSMLRGLGGGGGAGAGAAGSAGSGAATGVTWGMPASSASGAGASSASMSGLAAMGATIAIFAVIYFGVKSWIDHHRKEMEQFRIGDSGSGALSWSLGSAVTGIKRLGGVADQMVKTVNEVIRTLGGYIEGWSGDLTVSRSGHGKKTKYWVQYAEGMIEQFGNDAEAAFQFAMVQAIRQARIGGLPAEVQQAISTSAARNMEQLQAEIERAMMLVANRLGDTGFRVYEIFRKFALSIDEQIKRGLDLLRATLTAVRPGSGPTGESPGTAGALGGPGSLPASGYAKAASSIGKGETEAANAQLVAVRELIAARNREVEAIRNQLLGVDDSASSRLAGIASFNRGIEEAQNLVNAEIRQIEEQLAGLAGKTGESAEKLRAALQSYLEELTKMPEKISGQQLDLAIFDTLYRYLQGSGKYAAQAHKYAQLKVELEFAAIKAQLIALGKWEEFAEMFNDAYRAASAAAGRGPRKGSGNRAEERDDLREEAARFGLSDIGARMRDARQWFDDYAERVRKAGFSTKEAAVLIAEAGEELARRIAEIKNNVLRDVEAFKNAGTVRGGSLLSGLAGISSTSQKLIKDLEALRKAGELTGREFRVARREIEAAARRQKEALVSQAATSLLSDLYSLLGMDKEAAQLKFDLTMMELDIRREELYIAMQELQYTEERMNAILGPLDDLIRRVREAGPGIFDRNPPRETLRQDVSSGGSSGRNPAEIFREGVRSFVDAVKTYVEATQDLLTDPSLSILSPMDQVAEAERRFMAAVASARKGDVEAAASLGDLQRQALEAAQGAYGGGMDALGNAGYIAMFQRLLAAGRTVVTDPNALRLAGEAAVSKEAQESIITQRQFMAQSHADMLSLLQALDAVRMELGGTVYYRPNAFAAPGVGVSLPAGYTAGTGGAVTPPSRESLAVRDEIRELRRELRDSRRVQQTNEETIARNTGNTARNTEKAAYAAGREESLGLSRR